MVPPETNQCHSKSNLNGNRRWLDLSRGNCLLGIVAPDARIIQKYSFFSEATKSV